MQDQRMPDGKKVCEVLCFYPSGLDENIADHLRAFNTYPLGIGRIAGCFHSGFSQSRLLAVLFPATAGSSTS